MARSTATRKWLTTINNPVDKGFTHDRIKEIMSKTSYVYWCMSDEIGLEDQTFHTHIYQHYKNAVMFDTIRNRFYGGHHDMAKGTSKQNMEYVSKTGKWLNDKKRDTCIEGTFEEFGVLPAERQGKRNDLGDLYAMICDGYSNFQILEMMPEAILNISDIDRARMVVQQEIYKNKWRDVNVTYIYGSTGLGKTRSVMEQYGYDNVFRVTDYAHPFDSYKGQNVVIFEEFRSSIRLTDMLNYLDGYPLELPCRYSNKMACYTCVYIITNIPFTEQYKGFQADNPGDYLAFLRRINTVKHFTNSGIYVSHIEIDKDGFHPVPDGEMIPF